MLAESSRQCIPTMTCSIPEIDDVHIVLSQSSCFISTDDMCGAHSFAAGQSFDQIVFFEHLFDGKGKRKSNGQGQSFGHCHHNNNDSQHHISQYFSNMFGRIPAIRNDVIDEEPHCKYYKHNCSWREAEQSNLFSQIFQLLLKWSTLIVFLLNELIEFSLAMLFTHKKTKHMPFPAHNLRSADNNRRWSFLIAGTMQHTLR